VARLSRAVPGYREMRIDGDVAIIQGVQFRMFEHPPAANLEQMKLLALDEAQQRHSVAVKKCRRLVDGYQIRILLGPRAWLGSAL